MIELSIADFVNERCPFSGKPVTADSLTLYHGRVVGFCNPGCGDKFTANPEGFPDAMAKFDAFS